MANRIKKFLTKVNDAWIELKTKLTPVGSTTKSIFVNSDGDLQACTYSLNKTVPSDAVFTDTTYTLTQDSVNKHNLTFESSTGDSTTITTADNNTTYTLAQDSTDGHILIFTPSSGYETSLIIPDSDTTYTAGTGLVMTSENKINHSNSVTAGTVGTSSATSGASLAVPYITYDAQGHIKATGTHVHTVSGFLTSSSSLNAAKLTGTVPSSCISVSGMAPVWSSRASRSAGTTYTASTNGWVLVQRFSGTLTVGGITVYSSSVIDFCSKHEFDAYIAPVKSGQNYYSSNGYVYWIPAA